MGEGTPGDIVWTTSAYPVIVHSRVLNLLQSHSVTGWKTYPVEVRSKAGGVVPEYYGLAITGRCARVDLSKAEIVLREFPGGWIPHFLGRYFDQATWDGSDLFMEVPDTKGKVTACRFLTEKAWNVLRRAKIGNLRFCRLTEACVAASIYTIGSEHLLPADYRKRLAVAYREAGVPRPPWI